jgi:hypothetical protein
VVFTGLGRIPSEATVKLSGIDLNVWSPLMGCPINLSLEF